MAVSENTKEFFQVFSFPILVILIAVMALYHFEVIRGDFGVCSELFPSDIDTGFVKNSWMKTGGIEPGFFECCRYYYYNNRQQTQCRIFEEVLDGS